MTPVVIFAYNRLDTLIKTVQSLSKCKLSSDTDVYFFSDGPNHQSDSLKVEKVRRYVRTITTFNRVYLIERKENFGLAKSIITGVTEIVNKFGRVIVLEDDMVVSPNFLEYMNQGLEAYKNDNQVASIHGYVYPIKNLPNNFFIKGADCWGWATWKRAWDVFEPDGRVLYSELRKRKLLKNFDFNGSYPYSKMLKDQIKGRNNSWAIRWYASAYLQNMLTLYPGQSLVQNIGVGSDATHCKQQSDIFNVNITDSINIDKNIEVTENENVKLLMENYLYSIKQPLYKKIVARLFRK